jgi:hypothetical protein
MKITARKWCLLFSGICTLGITAIIAVNFFVMNSYGHFSKSRLGKSANDGFGVRTAKYRYIQENPDAYTGFIIGGSRTGTLDPKMASEFTGLSFYNFSFPSGRQEDYETAIDFLIAHTSVKQIILQLNGQEIRKAKSEFLPLFVLDSKISSKLYELKSELLVNCIPTLRNFLMRKPFYDIKVQENGMFECIEQHSPEERLNLNFVSKAIIPIFQKSYKNIFINKSAVTLPDAELVFESLWRIKRNCIENNVKLIIITAPSSIDVLSQIESPIYWEYLRGISRVTDFYNFNGYSRYNFNPYNFVDNAHYRREMSDKMLRIIFNQEQPPDDDWGILLNRDNIDTYLDRRKNAYFSLKSSYEETGIIPLGTMEDSSFIAPK